MASSRGHRWAKRRVSLQISPMRPSGPPLPSHTSPATRVRHPSPQPHVRAIRCVPGSALKLRAASCKICNLLNLPIPLPYFHTLVVLQNVCFAIMSWSLLSFVSFLTPIVLFFAVLVMVGLREVAVALSNPFGKDDVDFPIDKWIAQLRANALLVHRDNRVVSKPNRDESLTPTVDDEEEEEEDEDEDGDGVGAGAGGDDGGGGGEGGGKDDDDEMGGF